VSFKKKIPTQYNLVLRRGAELTESSDLGFGLELKG